MNYKSIILAVGALNLILGLAFLLWPNALARINNALKKEISTDRFEKAPERQRDIDGRIIRLRITFGIATIAVSLCLLYVYIRY